MKWNKIKDEDGDGAEILPTEEDSYLIWCEYEWPRFAVASFIPYNGWYANGGQVFPEYWAKLDPPV